MVPECVGPRPIKLPAIRPAMIAKAPPTLTGLNEDRNRFMIDMILQSPRQGTDGDQKSKGSSPRHSVRGGGKVAYHAGTDNGRDLASRRDRAWRRPVTSRRSAENRTYLGCRFRPRS